MGKSACMIIAVAVAFAGFAFRFFLKPHQHHQSSVFSLLCLFLHPILMILLLFTLLIYSITILEYTCILICFFCNTEIVHCPWISPLQWDWPTFAHLFGNFGVLSFAVNFVLSFSFISFAAEVVNFKSNFWFLTPCF